MTLLMNGHKALSPMEDPPNKHAFANGSTALRNGSDCDNSTLPRYVVQYYHVFIRAPRNHRNPQRGCVHVESPFDSSVESHAPLSSVHQLSDPALGLQDKRCLEKGFADTPLTERLSAGGPNEMK